MNLLKIARVPPVTVTPEATVREAVAEMVEVGVGAVAVIQEDEVVGIFTERDVIRKVVAGARMIELSPQNAYVRRKQHQLVQSHDLISHSRGKEPQRRVRIYRE